MWVIGTYVLDFRWCLLVDLKPHWFFCNTVFTQLSTKIIRFTWALHLLHYKSAARDHALSVSYTSGVRFTPVHLPQFRIVVLLISGSTRRLQQTTNGRWSAGIQLRSTQGTFTGTTVCKFHWLKTKKYFQHFSLFNLIKF